MRPHSNGMGRGGTGLGGAGRDGAPSTHTHTPNKSPHLGHSPPMLYCTVVHTRARFHDGRRGFRHWRSGLAQRACVCGYDLLHLPRLHVPHVNKPSTGPFQDAALAIQRARMTVRTVHVVLTVPRRRGGRQRVRCPRVFMLRSALHAMRRCVAWRCALQAESCEMRVASDGSRAARAARDAHHCPPAKAALLEYLGTVMGQRHRRPPAAGLRSLLSSVPLSTCGSAARDSHLRRPTLPLRPTPTYGPLPRKAPSHLRPPPASAVLRHAAQQLRRHGKSVPPVQSKGVREYGRAGQGRTKAL